MPQPRPIDLLKLRPWDAASYLQPPSVNSGAIAAGNSLAAAVPADPMRIILAIANSGLSGTLGYEPSGFTGTGIGLALPTATPNVWLTWWTHGPIVQGAWDFVAAPGANVTWAWIGWSVRSWPNEGDDPTEELMCAVRRMPTKGMNGDVPSVNDRKSAWGYWTALLKRLRGG